VRVRVVVVGGGLAGAASALELARCGAEPMLVAAAPGATALSWGTLDVAPAVPGSRRLRWRTPLRDAPLTGADRLAILTGAYATHPYAVLWRRPEVHAAAAGPDAGAPAEQAKRAAADLAAALAPHGLSLEGSLDENRLLADLHGVLRVSDFAFTGPASGCLAEASEIAWVTVRGLPGADARVALRRLAAERAALGLAPVPLRALELRLPEGLPLESMARLSAALERSEAAAAFREAARTLVDGPGAVGRVWLFPPVLGLASVAAQLAALRERLGGRVAETLGAVPEATAGFRLQRALEAALDAARVERHRARATGVETSEGRAAGVLLAPAPGAAPEPPARLAADAVVLATGRFLSGGLRDGPRGVVEPLLGLPLFDAQGERVDGRPARASVRRRWLDLQPLFSAGVAVDARLRPLAAADGAPVLPNLFAAGDLLGGFDPSRERTGLGVALLSGVLAARHAVAGGGG
jgi:glycerol-3-phosphate dehydrogenase subunit B